MSNITKKVILPGGRGFWKLFIRGRGLIIIFCSQMEGQCGGGGVYLEEEGLI